MKSDKKIPNEEIQKMKDYLQDSKKNIERLKLGKKPKRRIRYTLSENKVLFSIVFLILILSPFFSLIPKQEPPIIDPLQNIFADTMETIESNFTAENGLPVHELVSENTSSELIILSSLTNSMLIECGLLTNETHILERIAVIFDIVEGDSFRDYNNKSIKLPVFYQFLGIYSLFQAYYALSDTIYSFDFNYIGSIINTTIYNCLNYTIWPYLFAVSEETDISYLVDQALGVSVFSTYMLLTGNQTVYSWDLEEITNGMLDQIEYRFYISASRLFYHQHNITNLVSSGISTSADLMFTALGLSRLSKYSSSYSFPISSSTVHQKVIDELVDPNWLVHEVDKSDNSVTIQNQAFFTLISYLLNMEYVGFEVEDATSVFLYSEEGFVNSIDDSVVSAESCLYGLISISSNNWSNIQNNKEYAYVTRPYPTTTEYPPQAGFSAGGLISALLLLAVMTRIFRRYSKRRKFGDQAEI